MIPTEIDSVLQNWAAWARRQHTHLGYPSATPIARMMKYGLHRGSRNSPCYGLSYLDERLNERVDELLCKLAGFDLLAYQTVQQRYYYCVSGRVGAAKIQCNRATYYARLQAAQYWLAGKFDATAPTS